MYSHNKSKIIVAVVLAALTLTLLTSSYLTQVAVDGRMASDNKNDAGEIDAMPVQAVKAGPLDSIVITVDAGHGGYDSGAVGRKTGALEKDLNLNVARLVAEMLREAGATVVMTRDGDYALCPDDTPFGMLKKADMARRGEIIDSGYTQILLSVHMNEDRYASSSGPQVFYQTGDDEGKELAEYVQNALNLRIDPPKKRAVNDGDYFILRQGPLSALIECGFLSNAGEEALLRDEAYQDKLATAIYQGVLDYCGEHNLVPFGPKAP